MNVDEARELLVRAYSVYGEKDSPSLLLPKQADPTVGQVIQAATAAGYRARVRSCARYRGMMRVHLRPEAGKPEFRQMLNGL